MTRDTFFSFVVEKGFCECMNLYVHITSEHKGQGVFVEHHRDLPRSLIIGSGEEPEMCVEKTA